VTSIAAPQAGAVARPTGYAWYALGVMTVIYALNAVDRNIVAIVLEPIKQEFRLNDSQLGLLTGVAFIVSYVAAGFPLGLLVDRVRRNRLLAVVLFLWSGVTALGGLTQSFVQLLLVRLGVGATEAGGMPCIMSLTADFFPPARRPLAVSVIHLAMPIGMGVSFLIGGLVAADYGWRAAFFVAGGPGLLMAFLVIATIRDPARGAMQARPRAAAPADETAAGFTDAFRFILRRPPVMGAMLGMAIFSAGATALVSWLPSLFIREHHMTLKAAGAACAMATGLGTAVGLVISGWVADRYAAGSPRRGLQLAALWMAVTTLATLATLTWPTTAGALAALAVVGVFCFSHLAVIYAFLLNMTPARVRGVVISTHVILSSLAGYGSGPLGVGLISDAVGGPHSPKIALLAMSVFLGLGVVVMALSARAAPQDPPAEAA
jgi:MFS family permease